MSDALEVEPAGDSKSPVRSSRREEWLWAGLLVLLTLIVYQPAIRGAFLWDDDRHVTQNRALRSAEGLAKIWLHPSTTNRGDEPGYVTPQYYPLTHTTYWIEYHLWGLNPVGYHAVNMLLHAASALVLWQLLKLLRVPGAWVAAAIFAVHPIEVESVAWITERKNVLSGLFFFASIYAYVRFAEGVTKNGGEGEAESRPSLLRLHPGVWYAVAFALFAGAVFSKTVACAMPVVVGIILFWWYRWRIDWRAVVGLVPFLILGAALSRQTAWMEKHIVGAMGPEWEMGFTQRLLVAGHAFWFYLGKLIWPFGLTFTYPRWDVEAAGGGQWAYVVAAGVVILGAAVWLGVGKRLRGIAAAVLVYSVLLFPAMGFFNVYPMRYSFVADHFQYLAGVAVIVAVVGVIAGRVWRGEKGSGAQAVQGVAAAVILFLAVLAWRQSAIYASPVTLWEDTLAKNPDAWMAHYNLGIELSRQAIDERAAGDAEAAAKDFSEAANHFGRTTVLRPEHAKAYATWGLVLFETGRLAEAAEKLNRSIELDPKSDEPHVTLGMVRARENRPEEARAEFEKAIAIDPKAWLAYFRMGDLLVGQNKLAEAEGAYRAAVQIRPRDASSQYALATTLAREKKSEEALRHAGLAAQLQPENSNYLTTLGYLWAENGRPREAFEAFNRALQIDPDNKLAYEGVERLVKTAAEMKRAATRAATTRSTTQPATTGPVK